MTAPSTGCRCRCGHPKVRHDIPGMDGMCVAAHCQCLRFRADTNRSVPLQIEAVATIQKLETRNLVSLALAKHPDGLKRCPHCDTEKLLDEFNASSTAYDGLLGWCKRCLASRPTPQTKPRIIRNRARQRAMAELLREHEHEFKTLYDKHLREARIEAERLQNLPAAQTVYGASEHVRLRPGRRQPGESTADRIDVARCPHCIRFHDEGHVCAECGTAPQPHIGHAQAPIQPVTDWAVSS